MFANSCRLACPVAQGVKNAQRSSSQLCSRACKSDVSDGDNTGSEHITVCQTQDNSQACLVAAPKQFKALTK